MDIQRLSVASLTGSILGLVCIAGISIRLGFQGNEALLLVVWFNRLLMGILIGLAGKLEIVQSEKNIYIRGLLLGALMTGLLSILIGFYDLPSFFAGIVYGLVIDYVASNFAG